MSSSRHITDFYKLTKKRPRESEGPLKSVKLAGIVEDDQVIRVPVSPPRSTTTAAVPFTKKGLLSPTKKKQEDSKNIKALLKNKKKLSDLKAALEGFNGCANKLAQLRRDPVKPTTPEKFYSPTKDYSSNDVFSSPTKLKDIKTNVKKLPAYMRHDHLSRSSVEKNTEEPSIKPVEVVLPLPYSFRLLEDLFNGLETVVSILHNRKERITFRKVKSGVLELVRATGLTYTHLAQILTLYPDIYSLKQEKIQNKYELVFTVNEPVLSATFITTRRKEFKNRLQNYILNAHQKWLLTLPTPIVIPEGKRVTRWHPRFPLDTVKIEATVEVPQPPAEDKLSTAKDVIARAQNILAANPRMKKAVCDLANSTNNSDIPQIQTNLTQEKHKNTVNKLKGISNKLIEKIRMREAAKSLNELTETPESIRRKKMVSKLPEFVQIIRNTFIAEKKAALSLELIVQRVQHSSANSHMSQGQVEEHILLLCELLPNWIQRHSLTQGQFFKIHLQTDINDLINRLK